MVGGANTMNLTFLFAFGSSAECHRIVHSYYIAVPHVAFQLSIADESSTVLSL